MLVGETIYTLQLHYQDVLYQDVGEIVPYTMTLVGDGERGLGFSWDVAQGEFAHQGVLVDGLQEAGAESVRNLKDGA